MFDKRRTDMQIEDIDSITVSSQILARVFDVKTSRIRQLTADGIVKKESRGNYLLFESIKNYITLLKVKQLSNKSVNEIPTDLNLAEEKARHEYIKRQISEIRLALIRGQVHKSEDVSAVMTDMFTKFKSKMTAMPTKLAKKLEGKNRVQIQQILDDEINQALTELAAYNPNDFYSDDYVDVTDEQIQALGDEEDE